MLESESRGREILLSVLREVDGLLDELGESLCTVSKVLLAPIVPLLAIAWTMAATRGLTPSGPWGVSQGNHGPWHPFVFFNHDLAAITELAIFVLPLGATLVALVSLVLSPSKRTAVMFLISTAAFFVLMWSHGWLID